MKSENKGNLDKTINNIRHISSPRKEPEPTPPENPIQDSKKQWCFVGVHEGKRGCAEVDKNDNCLSGQLYPDRTSCINPNYTKNV